MRISFGQKVMIAVMVIAINLVFIYASGMLGYAGYALLLLASAATYTLTCEGMYGIAFASYILTSGLAYLIVPDKITAIAYFAFFGHYPLFKTYIDGHIHGKTAALCVKLLYCNAWLVTGLCFVLFVLEKSIPSIPMMPKWLVILCVEAVFVLLDCVHSFSRWLYTEKLRSGIVPKL